MRSHHKVGLHLPEGPSVDARLCRQSSRSVPTPAPHETATPTIPTRQAQLWRKNAIREGSEYIPPAGQDQQEVYTGGVRSFPFLGARSRWRTTPPSQRTGVPASESDGGNDEINQTIFGLHVHDGGGNTHIPRKQHGPRDRHLRRQNLPPPTARPARPSSSPPASRSILRSTLAFWSVIYSHGFAGTIRTVIMSSSRMERRLTPRKGPRSGWRRTCPDSGPRPCGHPPART